MENDKRTYLTWRHKAAALLFLTVMTLQLFRVTDKWQIGWLLLIAGWMGLRPLPFKRWSTIDKILVTITIYNLLSLTYAAVHIAGLHMLRLSMSSLAGYFLLRRLDNSKKIGQLIQKVSLLPITAAVILTLYTFILFRQSVLNVGFEEIYPFRFLFKPLGYITNVWAEGLILLLGWLCFYEKTPRSILFITLIAILLSFSRGAYIALGVYLLLWLCLVKPIQEKLKFFILAASAISLITFLLPKETKTTLQIHHTASQRQSTEGRILASTHALKMFQQHILLGNGTGQYTLAMDQLLNQDSRLAYTTLAPNLIVQLCIEKGIIGIGLYLWLAWAIGQLLWRKRDQRKSQIICCLLIALLLKEMTQATALNTPFILFLFYALLAFLQKSDSSKEVESKHITHSAYLMPGMILLCYIGYITIVCQLDKEQTGLQQGEKAFAKGDYIKAFKQMEQTGEQTANLINRGWMYSIYIQKSGDTSKLQQAEQNLSKAWKQQPQDIQICYLLTRLYIDNNRMQQALPMAEDLVKQQPKNSLYLAALSDILYKLGKKERALQYLTQAIHYTPRLLTGKRIEKLKEKDPSCFNQLQHLLTALVSIPANNPADNARLGYIAHWLGNRTLAKSYLLKAVKELPNLSTPWHLLGDDNKYRLLLYGAFQKDLSLQKLPEEQRMSDEQLFFKTYLPKFNTWYGKELWNPSLKTSS